VSLQLLFLIQYLAESIFKFIENQKMMISTKT